MRAENGTLRVASRLRVGVDVVRDRMRGEFNALALIPSPRSSPCSFCHSVKCRSEFRDKTPSREESRRTFYGMLALSHAAGFFGVRRNRKACQDYPYTVGVRVLRFGQSSWSQPCRSA